MLLAVLPLVNFVTKYLYTQYKALHICRSEIVLQSAHTEKPRPFSFSHLVSVTKTVMLYGTLNIQDLEPLHIPNAPTQLCECTTAWGALHNDCHCSLLCSYCLGVVSVSLQLSLALEL